MKAIKYGYSSFLILALLLILIKCDMVFNKPGADPVQSPADSIQNQKAADSISLLSEDSTSWMGMESTEDLMLKGGARMVDIETGKTETLIFLFRLPATDPDGDPMTYVILSQPVRGMFILSKSYGDMYITKTALSTIEKYVGKQLDVVVLVSDGKLSSKAVMSFIVGKSPDGRHFLGRQLGIA